MWFGLVSKRDELASDLPLPLSQHQHLHDRQDLLRAEWLQKRGHRIPKDLHNPGLELELC